MTCQYNALWWIGMIQNIYEDGDILVKFLHPHGPSKSFYWPSQDDWCYVPLRNILCLISSPSTSTGRTNKILNDDYDKTILAFAKSNTD